MRLKALLAVAVLTSSLGGTAYAQQAATLDLVEPIAEYKIYVSEKLQKLVADTKTFTDAVKAGNVDKAKSLFAPTRMSYEAIEPIAELFSDLDAAIDSRADDYENGEKNPEFPGFHRIEYGLWEQNSTEGLTPVADKLMADVTALSQRITDMTLPPEKVVGGAAALMEEVAATKISGEEDRYSHTDLWDFKGNFDGSEKIFILVRPLIEKKDPDFVKKVADNFSVVGTTLAKYKSGEGYQSYDKLTDDDRKVLASAVNTLAEDLSTLRGKLGLN
ncbi:MAG: iron uptake system protein EfeO [Chelatococcus sp.]|uniref:iron uptake system protein EfeO n=1 Tax=Chelatococcus sp. TaxID=1953771 RepID=UPI0025C5358C|nr:iron uptake system protein EfeO [Chelatococcus sp.]MBX3538425.1 iron uptake system protein EfeO [Chelatococcus sp.]